MTELHDRYRGVGSGLVIGDSHCAPFEGGPLEKGLWRLIGRTGGRRRFTDDTQMAFDLGHHLVYNHKIDRQALAKEFADSYRWSRGYGPSTVAVLKQIKKGKSWQEAATHRFKDGSFGNGAAMRIAPLAVFLHQKASDAQMQQMIYESAEVTHPNQMAKDGAMAVAKSIMAGLDGLDCLANVTAVQGVVQSTEFKSKFDQVCTWIKNGFSNSVIGAKKTIGAGAAAIESCPVAIYIGLMHCGDNLVKVIESSNAGGGDTDTIGAMAGAIWGAHNGYGAIPESMLNVTEGITEMNHLISDLRDRHPSWHSSGTP